MLPNVSSFEGVPDNYIMQSKPLHSVRYLTTEHGMQLYVMLMTDDLEYLWRRSTTTTQVLRTQTRLPLTGHVPDTRPFSTNLYRTVTVEGQPITKQELCVEKCQAFL
ncbi:hypothetical protein M8J76_013832 [Diaphorina citri]|nr:hypothetical protein M8J76_013832 [Diaphorina citri]